MARNKIGFHIGSQPNATGYGDYIRALDAAGIPAVCMSMAGEGIGDIIGCWDNGSTVPHVVVVRYMPPPGHPDGNQDVPRYDMEPEAAFVRFWSWVKPLIGNDVKRYSQRIVIKMGNELDKGQAEWLAEFYLVGHDIMQSDPDGPFRLGAFSFASGEPEPEHWRGPRMLDYLRLCADDPIGASIVLHEYSYADTLQSGYPFLIGRFQDLFAACDENGIKRPYVYIHEFGYRQDTMPPVNEAMSQLPWAAELYAQFSEIKGAGLWTLQGSGSYGNPHISKFVQPMIEPVKNYTLAAEFPDPPINEEPPMDCEPRVPYSRKYLVAPQDATLEEWIAICQAAFPNRNSVTFSYDDAGHAPGVTSNTAVLHGIPLDLQQLFVEWYAAHYPETAVEFVDDTPPTPPLEIFDIVDQLPKHATLKYATRPLDGITTLTIHHTVSPPDRSIESIAAYHVDSNGWPGIGYHFVIKDDGRIFQTNHLTTKSYHAGTTAAPGDENLVSVGISLQGDFTNAPPPQAQQDAARALVVYLRGLLPSVTAVLGHRQMPGAATQCPGNTWAAWLPYVAGGEVAQPEPEPPPPAPTIDLLQWFRGDHRRQFDKEYKLANGVTGTQTTQVFHLNNGNDWLYIKGEQGHYEHLGIRQWDGQEWIFRFEDTSEANDRWYSHFMSDGGAIGAPWLPRFAEVGKWYETAKFVQHYNKDASGKPICTKLNSGNVVDKLRIVSEPYGRAYESGQVLQVVTAEWDSGEQYDFAGGNVAFRNAAGDNFWFMQWLEGRADKTYKKVDCLPVGW